MCLVVTKICGHVKGQLARGFSRGVSLISPVREKGELHKVQKICAYQHSRDVPVK